MNIDWIQQFWFDDHYNDTSTVERHTITIDAFGTRNVAVSCALNVFGPGATIEIADNTITGTVGYAAVGVKWYEYIDANNQFRHVDNTTFFPCLQIENCVGFQIELALVLAWVSATGTVHYYTT